MREAKSCVTQPWTAPTNEHKTVLAHILRKQGSTLHAQMVNANDNLTLQDGCIGPQAKAHAAPGGQAAMRLPAGLSAGSIKRVRRTHAVHWRELVRLRTAACCLRPQRVA